MKSNQHVTNVLEKYNKWLTNGQKKAIKKRANAISMQNAKTRSELQSSAIISTKKTNEYQSSMGLANSLNRAPSSGVDEQNRKMPEFKQQLQSLRPGEQYQLDKYGKQKAQETIAAREAAAHQGNGLYRVVDPNTGEMMKDASGNYIWTSKRNKYTVEHGGTVESINGSSSSSSSGTRQAVITPTAINALEKNAQYVANQKASSNALYGVGSTSTWATSGTQSWANTQSTFKQAADIVTKAFSNLSSFLSGKATATLVATDSNAIDVGKLQKQELTRVVQARKQARDVIQYAADVGAITQATADFYKSSVNSGTANLDSIGTYLSQRIGEHQAVSVNYYTNKMLEDTKATCDAQRYATSAARAVYEAYTQVQATGGSTEAYNNMVTAYQAFINEQNDAALQNARKIVTKALEYGMDPNLAFEAMYAYKHGDIDKYNEIVNSGVNAVTEQTIRAAAEECVANGEMAQETLDAVNEKLKEGDYAGAQQVMNDGVEQYYHDNLKQYVVSAFKEAASNDAVYKGTDATAWQRFKALYRVAEAADSTDAWKTALTAYNELVTSIYNAEVLKAKTTVEDAQRLGLSDENADAAMEAFKAGDTDGYYDALNKIDFGGEPIGYVDALAKDWTIQQIAGIDLKTYNQYKDLTDEDIDNAITNLENSADSKEVRTLRWMKEYKENIAKGLSIENGDFSTWLTGNEMAEADSMSIEEIDEQIAALTGNKEKQIEELNAVKTMREAFREQDKLAEYEKMSEDELSKAVEQLESDIETIEQLGSKEYGAGFLNSTQTAQLEEKKAEAVLASYALGKKQEETRGNDYKELVTTPLEALKADENYTKTVAAVSASKDAPNAAVKYVDGNWYYQYDNGEEETNEYGLKVRGREITSAETYASLGWSGVYESYYNAQVFKNKEGKYVVYSTVTNNGTAMPPQWADRYQTNLNAGMDPDHLKMGEFDSREEAEEFISNSENDAYYYSDTTDVDEYKVTGAEAEALNLYKLITNPDMLWAGWCDAGNVTEGLYLNAYYLDAESRIEKGTEANESKMGALAYDAIKSGHTLDNNKALVKEARKIGSDAIEDAYNWYAYATDDEKSLLAYYSATDLKKAGEYKKSMDTFINERVMNDVKEMADEFAGNEVVDEDGNVVTERKVGTAIISQLSTFLIKPLEVTGGIYALWQSIKGEDIDPYSKAFTYTIFDSEIRQSHYAQLQKDLGDGFISNASVYLLQNIDSGIDSMFAGYLGAGLAGGSAAIATSKVAATTAKAATLGLMSLSAAGATAQNLTAQGVPQAQAKKLSLLSGAFEALFEVVEVDTFFKGMTDPTLSFGKRLLGNFINEGIGEGMTDVANLAADIAIRGNQADMRQEIAERMLNGQKYSTAAALTFWNELGEIGLSVLGGGLMGAESAVATTVTANLKARASGKKLRKAGYADAVVGAAQASGDSDVQSAWSKIRAGYNAKKGYSNLDIGRLNYALQLSNLDVLTEKVNSMAENGDITAEEAQKINSYLAKLSGKAKAEGTEVAHSIDVDTSDIADVAKDTIAKVSEEAYETAQTYVVTEKSGKDTQVTAENIEEILRSDVKSEEKVADGVTVVRHTDGELDGLARTQALFAQAIAKACGINISVHDTLPLNGVAIGNTLHVSLTASRGFVSTVAHELTHWMKTQSSQESFEALSKFLQKQAGKQRYQKLLAQETEKAKGAHLKSDSMSDAEYNAMIRSIAEEEVTAILCETMLNDETSVRELLMTDATLFEKIYQWINDVLNSFRDLLASDQSVRGNREAEKYVRDMEKARDLWYKCLMEAKNGNTSEAAETIRFDENGNRFSVDDDKVFDENINGISVKGKGQHVSVTFEDKEYSTSDMRNLFETLGGTDDAQIKDIADKVFDFCEEHGIRYKSNISETIPGEGRTAAGYYLGDMVRLNEDEFGHKRTPTGWKAEVILHESIHAATVYAMSNFDRGMPMAPSQAQAVEEIKAIYNEIKDDPYFKGAYGITNEREMVAELANPNFCEALKGKRSSNLLIRIVDAIKKLFGIDTQRTNRYEGVRDAVLGILQNEREEYYEPFRHHLSYMQLSVLGGKNAQADFAQGWKGARFSVEDEALDAKESEKDSVNTYIDGRNTVYGLGNVEYKESGSSSNPGLSLSGATHDGASANNGIVAEGNKLVNGEKEFFPSNHSEYNRSEQGQAGNKGSVEANTVANESTGDGASSSPENKVRLSVDDDANDSTSDEARPKAASVSEPKRDIFAEARERQKSYRAIGSTARVNESQANAAHPDLDAAKAAIADVQKDDGTVERSPIIQAIARGIRRVPRFGTLDPARMLDKLAGGNQELRDQLKEAIEDPFNEAGTKYALQLKQRREAYDAEMERLGITKDKKYSEAAQKYGEGGYVDDNGDWQPYTEEDLVKEVGDMAPNVKAAVDITRDMYDQYIDELNEMREAIYPNIIEHAETKHEDLQRRVDLAEGKVKEQTKLIAEIEAKLEQQNADLEKKREGTQVRTNLINSIAANEARLENARVLLEHYTSKAVVSRMQMQQIEDAVASGELLKNRKIQRRADYFHHFVEAREGVAGLLQVLSQDAEIDPKLAGKTADTRPKTRWTGFMQRRTGNRTTIDMIKGMHLYMMDAERDLAFDPYTAYLTELEGKLREEGTAIQAEAGAGMEHTEDMNRWIAAWRNSILGKSQAMDRSFSDSGIAGRKLMKVFDWINGRVKSNSVLGNFHSACVQISNLNNAFTYVQNPVDWMNAARLLIQLKSGNETVKTALESSGFMTQRYGLDFTEYDHKSSPKDLALWMLGAGDEAAGKLMWLAAYSKYTRDKAAANKNGNHNYRSAVEYADDITRRSTAGRGIGEQPTLITSKIMTAIAPFQLEVNNSWQNMKEMVGAKAAGRLTSYFLTTFLMNTALKALFGDKPLPFDLLGAAVDAIGGADDDDDEEDKSTAEIVRTVMQAMGGTVANGIPYASALFSMAGDYIDDLFGDYSPTMYGTGNIGLSGLADTIKGTVNFTKNAVSGNYDSADKLITGFLDNSEWLKLVMPWGGAQLQRSLKAADTMRKGYSSKVNSEGEEEAQFPYEHGFFKDLRTFTMGKWATDEGEAYLSGETKGLSAENTAIMKEAQAAGMEPTDFFSKLAELKAQKASKNAEGKTLVSSGLKVIDNLRRDTTMTDEQKLLMLKAKDANAYEDAAAVTEAGVQLSDWFKYKLKENGTEKKTVREELLMDKSLTPEQKATIDKALWKTDEKTPDYSSATAFTLSTSSDSVKEKTAAMTELGVKTEKALFYLGYDKNDGIGKAKLEERLYKDKDLTTEQKAGMEKILSGSDKARRDYSSDLLFKMSEGGLDSAKYKMATAATAAGIPEASAEKYINLKDSEVPDEDDVNKTRSLKKGEWREALMDDTTLTKEQKVSIEKAVYGTEDDKMPDYSSRDAFDISVMSDSKKAKATAMTAAGLSADTAKKYAEAEGKKDEVLDTLYKDDSLTAEQKAAVEKALYQSDTTRDYSDADAYLASTEYANSTKKQSEALRLKKKGVAVETYVKYDKLKGEDGNDANKATTCDALYADKTLTAKQKQELEKSLYPTKSGFYRDYTSADWYYISSKGESQYNKAKIAEKHGISVATYVAETKLYYEWVDGKKGSGKDGALTKKDKQAIIASVVKDKSQQNLLYNIVTGKVKE